MTKHMKAQDDSLSQSVTFGLKFARVGHPDYPSSMDQSVRELYQNLNPKVKNHQYNSMCLQSLIQLNVSEIFNTTRCV